MFGNSPDETAFARLILFKEHTQNAIMMLQPQLLRYALGEPPQPALVDVSSIVPEHVLFLDSYFYVVVYHGNQVARWRQEGCALICVQVELLAPASWLHLLCICAAGVHSKCQRARALCVPSCSHLTTCKATRSMQWCYCPSMRQQHAPPCRYQHSPEHAEFAALLRQPQDEALAVMRRRFPVPRVVDADQFTVAGRSQSRFLLVKLNPSATHASTGGGGGGEVIFTDDVSLDVFIDHLKTLAVQS